MSFDGIYNITLNRGNPAANSAVVATDGVNLVAVNRNDPKQKWSIRPVGGAGANAYVISSAYTGSYVVPNGDSLSYSLNPYVWTIPSASGFVSTGNLNWLPRPDGRVKWNFTRHHVTRLKELQAIIITQNRDWTWTIQA